ncbi:MAG TPA: histidine kinase [Vicinamibacterales bacterium]|jgi:signal transduction histidine kinase|nr:histidine kinase [Vicinamibacterales bacterium]
MGQSSASISSRAEKERVIAAARVALAVASLFAVWLDPAEPARYAETVYSLHVVYVVYSLVLAAIMWSRATWRFPVSARLPLATHVSDIIFVSILQYLTLGPSSPFFLYFQFSLFCAALRWGWEGTLYTAVATFVTYMAMAASMIGRMGPGEFELDRFIIRAVYLVVSAAILVYLGRHESRLRGEIERLARWPVASGVEDRDILEQVMEHAAGIVGAGRAVAVWDAGEEPTVRVASWSPSGAYASSHAPSVFYPLLPDALESSTIICAGPVSHTSQLLVSTGQGRISEVEGSLNAQILPLLAGTGLASAAFKTERVSGRVFFTDLGVPADVVALTEIVAREIGASLDQLFINAQMKEIAAGEERIRVARDLHDGVLQSLTGIRLEIRAVAAALDETPSTRDRLFAIERALAIEQRELRFFIGGLGPGGPRDESTLEGRLHAMRERVALEWKAPVTIRYAANGAVLPERIERAVPLMVHEAVVNALKHGQPSRVAVSVLGAPDELRVVVSDDGHGFPFRGRFDHATLTASKIGPKSLLDRVSALGGRLSIESGDAGSRIEVILSFEGAAWPASA